MALDTVADYIARARGLLQDLVPPYRYPDADLIGYLDEGIQESRGKRPDLWLAFLNGSLPSYASAGPTAAVAIDPMLRMAFVYYIAARAELSDHEDVETQRAMLFMTKFTTMLVGGAVA